MKKINSKATSTTSKYMSGGPIKKLKKAELGMATEESCGPGRPKCGKTRTIRSGKTQRFKTGPAPGRTWMSSIAKGGSTEAMCPPGGCGHKRAQKANNRRAAANAAGPVLKKIGTAIGSIAAGALAYTKNVGGIKDKIQDLKENKKGGSVKTKRSVGSTTKRKK